MVRGRPSGGARRGVGGAPRAGAETRRPSCAVDRRIVASVRRPDAGSGDAARVWPLGPCGAGVGDRVALRRRPGRGGSRGSAPPDIRLGAPGPSECRARRKPLGTLSSRGRGMDIRAASRRGHRSGAGVGRRLLAPRQAGRAAGMGRGESPKALAAGGVLPSLCGHRERMVDRHRAGRLDRGGRRSRTTAARHRERLVHLLTP